MQKIIVTIFISLLLVSTAGAVQKDPVTRVVEEYDSIEFRFDSGAINRTTRDDELLLLRVKAKYEAHKASFGPNEDRYTSFPFDVKIEKHRRVVLDPSLCQTQECLTFVDIHEGRFK